MCLDKVESREDTGPGIGYKVFYASPNGSLMGFYCRYCTFNPPGHINVDKNNGILVNDNNELYETGYHIYTDEEAVKNYIRICKERKSKGDKDCYFSVYKVSYDRVVATGRDTGIFRVVVAKEMTILEELTN